MLPVNLLESRKCIFLRLLFSNTLLPFVFNVYFTFATIIYMLSIVKSNTYHE